MNQQKLLPFIVHPNFSTVDVGKKILNLHEQLDYALQEKKLLDHYIESLQGSLRTLSNTPEHYFQFKEYFI